MFVNFNMPEETKNKIVESTLSLIDKKPFPQVRTREIAEKSAISEATIFKYFKTKDSILDNLVDKFLSIITDLDLSHVENEEDFRNALIHFFTKSYKVNYLRRRIFKFVLYICMYKQDTFFTLNNIINTKLIDPIEKIVEIGKNNWGYNKKFDTKINVRLLMHSLTFFTIHQGVFGAEKVDKYDMDKAIRIAVDNFLKSLK
jgi:AcrR family transcriptional regulator